MKIKLRPLVAASLLISPFASAELMITGVFDGPLSGGLPKGVEIYTSSDIADLSRYGLGGANNGGGSDGEEFTFPAVPLNAGEYLYIASEVEGFTAFMGFAPDYTSFAMNINGDDAIELFKDGEVIDLFGDIDTDGSGTEWEYMDGWAYRLSTNTNTNTISANTVFAASEWQFSGPNALDGFADNSSAVTPIPLASFTDNSEPTDPEPTEITLISTIQGSPATQGSNAFGDNDVSPLIGEAVTIEAIVVGDFQENDADANRNLRGFYVQEEDSDSDGDNQTSEGVFIFSNSFPTDVNLGDKVQVTGSVTQYFGETQISDITAITLLDSENLHLVTPAEIILDAASAVTVGGDGKYQPDLEAFEGMLVSFPQNLTITEQFQLDRFNEIKLVAGARPFQFTQKNMPDAVLYELAQRELGAIRITYDDGLNEQNANVGQLDGFANYSEANAQRMGDTIQGLVGVLDYKWAGNSASQSTWRVRSHLNGSNIFTSSEQGNSSNPRPSNFEAPLGNLTIASLNVLNLFTTLDDGNTQTAAGHSPRGADDLSRFGVEPATAEFDRQLQKITQAIIAMDADILGLVEIENDFDAINDGSTAIEVLINALNTELGDNIYDYVFPGNQFVGTDAIAVAFIFKPAAVAITENTTPALLDDAIAATLPSFINHDFNSDPVFNGSATNRVSLAVSFTHLASGETMTIAANHFKSKGSSSLSDETSPNFDQNNGAGFWNQRRLNAAIAVDEWLISQPTGAATDNRIILGDLNAYAMEDPIQHLIDNGFSNVEGPEAYSYVFDGQIGTLDYLLISDDLVNAFTSASVWHINADEADALDYNLDFGKSSAYFDASTATRNSDHDPVVAGFEFYSQATYQYLKPLIKAAKQDKSLLGTGKNRQWQHYNLWRFVEIIRKSDKAVRHGRFNKACRLLDKAAMRIDSKRFPRDWGYGDATSKILTAISSNRKAIGCP